jgi:hypothetical protein
MAENTENWQERERDSKEVAAGKLANLMVTGLGGPSVG